MVNISNNFKTTKLILIFLIKTARCKTKRVHKIYNYSYLQEKLSRLILESDEMHPIQMPQ